ncbi:MAG TPA: succinate dehydrogenase, hydrophobic membrane anchor protein [Allosphingosinicella sp.]|jgi:succinate dehydrogenase / fumarate reductase membrane anchor subunit
MTMETPIARVRGLGSAKSGAHHWWLERLTSVALLVLFVWFIASVLRLPDLSYGTVREWLADPLAAVPMLLLVAVSFWHGKMGMQVVIEDYVHEAGSKAFAITLLNFFTVAGAGLAVFAILKIAFSVTTGTPAPGA